MTSTGGYDSQANGPVEERILAIVLMAKCLMDQAGLPVGYWDLACTHANEILNRSKIGGRDPPLLQELKLLLPPEGAEKRFNEEDYMSWPPFGCSLVG